MFSNARLSQKQVNINVSTLWAGQQNFSQVKLNFIESVKTSNVVLARSDFSGFLDDNILLTTFHLTPALSC